jgi:hypothetical protein
VGPQGNVGLGHVRYPTAGSSSSAEAQPLYTNYPYGLCAAHNGNLTNTAQLREAMSSGLRHINTTSVRRWLRGGSYVPRAGGPMCACRLCRRTRSFCSTCSPRSSSAP